MEFKSGPQYTKAIVDRTVTGLFAVHGNEDSVADVGHAGMFAKTVQERGGTIRFLWNHDFKSPPVAAIKAIRELALADVPAAVLAVAPDATGAVEVEREYLDTPRGNEILAGLKAGAITEMSYGFDPIKVDFQSKSDGSRVRHLLECRLLDISDVLWGANEATLAAKARWDWDTLLAQLAAHLADQKSGARHSAADTAQLNTIHAAVVALGATSCKGILDPAADAGAKSRADTSVLVPLTQLQARLQAFEISLL